MRRGNSGVIGRYQNFGAAGVMSLAELQQSKSGFIAGYNVMYLVVAGGGGGSAQGAGAGGYLANIITVLPGVQYAVTIGAGGAAGANGVNSSFGSLIIATGGGAGAAAGGSSGGSNTTTPILPSVTGQGNRGGAYDGSQSYGHNAGGGAFGVGGGNSGPYGAGSGGIGAMNNITGALAYYAGGGGGGADTNYGSGGNGGLGGGGGANLANQNGVANTGGGGGGAWNGAVPRAAGAGGSGVIAVAYQNTTQRALGGVVTSYTYSGRVVWCHLFNTTGVYTA